MCSLHTQMSNLNFLRWKTGNPTRNGMLISAFNQKLENAISFAGLLGLILCALKC